MMSLKKRENNVIYFLHIVFDIKFKFYDKNKNKKIVCSSISKIQIFEMGVVNVRMNITSSRLLSD
jgi:hypothetical protein